MVIIHQFNYCPFFSRFVDLNTGGYPRTKYIIETEYHVAIREEPFKSSSGYGTYEAITFSRVDSNKNDTNGDPVK